MSVKSYFEHKLLFVFIIILVGILTLAAKTYKNNQIHDNTTWWVEHTKDALEVAAELSNDIKDLESSVRAYLITGDSSFLTSFGDDQQLINTHFSQLQSLTLDDLAQQERVQLLQSLVAQKTDRANQSITLRNTEGFKAAQAFFRLNIGSSPGKQIDSLLNRIQIEERRLLKARTQANARSSRDFTQFYLGLITLLTILLTTFFIVLWRNLRSRQKAELSLRESRELLQSVIDNTTALIYIKDLKGRFTLVNKQFEKVHQLQGGEAIGKTVFDVIPAQYALQHSQNDQRVLSKGLLLETQEETELNGKRNHFFSIKFPLRNREGTIYAVGGISTNITDVITRQQLEKQRQIAETTIDAQEKERSLLSRELHDNVNQILTHAKLCLEIAATNEDLQKSFLQKCQEGIQKAITEIRSLSHSLAAPYFEGDRFTDAIAGLTEDIQLGHPIKTALLFGEEDAINLLPEKVKLSLYRIIQEQVNNIIKHAQASAIAIDLKLQNDDIYLSITDDGIGFDTQSKTKGIGLRNIQSRAEFYAGTMRITSTPNRGCKLEVEIPAYGYKKT